MVVEKIKNNNNKLAEIADKSGIDPKVMELLMKGKPKGEDYDISQEEANTLFALYDEEAKKKPSMGQMAMARSGAMNAETPATQMTKDPETGPILRSYVRWKTGIAGQTSKDRKKLERAAEKINSDELSHNLQAKTWPSDKMSEMKENIHTIVQHTGFDSKGGQLVDDSYQPLNKKKINLDKTEFAAYTQVPDFDGNYYAKGYDSENQKEVNFRMGPVMTKDIGREILNMVGTRTDQEAVEMRATGQGMLGIGAANQINNLSIDGELSSILGDPRILTTPSGNTAKIRRTPNNMFGVYAMVKDPETGLLIERIMKTGKTNPKTGEPILHIYSSAEEMNQNFVIPRQKILASQ